MGNASAVCPFLPVVVVAANKELRMASSVASMAAINNGEVASFCNTGLLVTGLFGIKGTLSASAVEKAMA